MIMELEKEEMKKEFIAYDLKVSSIKDIPTLNNNVYNKIELIRIMHCPNLKSMMVDLYYVFSYR